MFQAILSSILGKFLTPKTVDGVLAAFKKTIVDLEQVRAAKLDEANTKSELAAQALTDANNARREADRALQVAERLSNLVEA
jgi:hypothetical protein